MTDFLNLNYLRVVTHQDKADHYLVLAEGNLHGLATDDELEQSSAQCADRQGTELVPAFLQQP